MISGKRYIVCTNQYPDFKQPLRVSKIACSVALFIQTGDEIKKISDGSYIQKITQYIPAENFQCTAHYSNINQLHDTYYVSYINRLHLRCIHTYIHYTHTYLVLHTDNVHCTLSAVIIMTKLPSVLIMCSQVMTLTTCLYECLSQFPLSSRLDSDRVLSPSLLHALYSAIKHTY